MKNQPIQKPDKLLRSSDAARPLARILARELPEQVIQTLVNANSKDKHQRRSR